LAEEPVPQHWQEVTQRLPGMRAEWLRAWESAVRCSDIRLRVHDLQGEALGVAFEAATEH
jgi:hypothetical protein